MKEKEEFWCFFSEIACILMTMEYMQVQAYLALLNFALSTVLIRYLHIESVWQPCTESSPLAQFFQQHLVASCLCVTFWYFIIIMFDMVIRDR